MMSNHDHRLSRWYEEGPQKEPSRSVRRLDRIVYVGLADDLK